MPHLVDSTVWSKARTHPALAQWFNAQVRGDLVLICDVIVLELLRSARNAGAFKQQAELLASLSSLPIGSNEWDRARQIQGLLARRGEHRGVPPADHVIAATAELAQVPLLHYDHDFDLVSAVTRQPSRWLLPRGSIP